MFTLTVPVMDDVETLVTLAQGHTNSRERRHDAFDALVVRFQDMAYGYAYALLGDDALAQDAAQEAFITAYQSLDQLRDPRAFPGWLRRIVFTQTTRLTRGKHFTIQPVETALNVSSNLPDPSTEVESRELKDHLHAAIQTLPDHQRTATILYYIDGYSQNEVADFLETSVDAVKKQLQRARSHLQERMIDMVQDDLHSHRPSKDDRMLQAIRLATTLKAAADHIQLATLELMLVDGIDVNALDEDGQTMLDWAVQQGSEEAVEFLLDRGADLTVRNASGRTPLQEAVAQGNKLIAELLRKRGAKG